MDNFHQTKPAPVASPKNFSLGKATLDTKTPPVRVSRFARSWRLPLFLLGIALLGGALFFFSLGARFTQSLQFENTPISFFEGVRLVGKGLFVKDTPLKGEEDGQINILLLGRAGEHHPGKNLTDTVMILSLNIEKKRVALLSLPRDLLAPIPHTNQATKLNALYQYGLSSGQNADLVQKSVTEITGLPLHYFASIDFDGFEQVIDDLGGINVEVLRDIYDPRYPGANYSYETFELKKGWQKLDGKTALKYARERHNDPEGDFGRAKRQQQIMQAVRERVWSLPTLVNPLTLSRLLDNLGESVKTDLTPEEAHHLFTLAEHFDTRNITTVVVDAWKRDSLLRVTHVDTGKGMAFALVPRSGTWKEVQALAAHLFEMNTLTERRDKIAQEAATLLILTAPSTLKTAHELKSDIMEVFPIKSITVRSLPALEKEAETAMIQTVDSSKLYTLDTLMDRYNVERVDTFPVTFSSTSDQADIVLLYTRATIPGLQYETPSTTEDSDFQELFPSLPRTNR